MTEWLYHLPVVWMAVVVTAVTLLATAMIYAVVQSLATGARATAFKGVSAVTLTPLAVVFGLLVGFLAAQVWKDVDRANAALTREASALRTVVALSSSFHREFEEQIRAFVRRHIDEAVNREWPAMAEGEAALSTIKADDTEALKLTLALSPQDASQALAQREMIAALENALDARRERIIVSRSTINGVKWTVLIVLATIILTTNAIVHSDNRTSAAIAMTLFAIGVAACVVLIASHNRPFTGEISIGPDLLLQVMPEQ